MQIELDLITSCVNRERRAQYELYKLTYSYLMSICLRYTQSKEEAEEALNTGFLKILEGLKNYRTEVPFKSWIRKIMVNTLIDSYRKKRKMNETIQYTDTIETMAETGGVEITHGMDAEQIRGLIKCLPPVSQQVFNLYAIDGFAHKEIAGMLNISEGTSKWHVNFSRNELKKKINEFVSKTSTL